MSALTYINFTNPKTGQSLAKARDGQVLNLVGAPVFRAGEFWNRSSLQGLEIAEAVTNLIPADVDPTCKSTAGLATGGTNTLAVSSLQALFEGSSIKASWIDSTTLLTDTMTLPTVSVTYDVSMYIWVPQNWDGGNLECSPDETTFTSGSKSVVDSWLSASSPRETWFRLTATLTVATDVTGIALRLLASSAPTAGKFVYIDGLQIEQRAYPTPFHPSNVNARISQYVKMPLGGNFPSFDAGTIILTLTPDFEFDYATTDDPVFWSFHFDANERWALSYNVGPGTDVFSFFMDDGTTTNIRSATQTFTRGDKIMLIATWDGINGDLWTNNVKSITGTKTQRKPTLPGAMYIGDYAGALGSNPANSVIDEFAILDVVCNDRLATKLYNNFLAKKTIAQLISI